MPSAPSYSISVGTTATLLVGYVSNRIAVTFCNNGTGTVFLNTTPNVTVGTGPYAGVPLLVNEKATFASRDDDSPEVAWYGITSSGSQDIRVLETMSSV